jgi:hypothetical protein
VVCEFLSKPIRGLTQRSTRTPAGGASPKPRSLVTLLVSQRESGTVKTLAFGVAMVIVIVGIVGILLPSGLVWIALHSVTSGTFYVIATVRVAFGLVLISVASASRAPKTLRVLGYLILVAGIMTALTGLLAIESAHVIIEWWLQQGFGVVRITGVLVMALGGFVAYACAPTRRAV